MSDRDGGWDWFAEAEPRPAEMAAVEQAFARCFAGAEGARALAHLRGLTLDRALGPESSEAALRHLEGQRRLVIHIAALIDRGRGLAPRGTAARIFEKEES